MSGQTIAVIPLATATSQQISVMLQPGAVGGMAKIVQAAILLLGTEPGSMRYLPGLGASPLRKLKSISLADQSQIQQLLDETATAIAEQLELLFPANSSSADEQVAGVSMQLDSYDPVSSLITATLQLDTAFGQTAGYPVTFSQTL